MLSAFRRSLDTWPVRVFFGLMVVAFVVWGAGDVVRQIGQSTWLAKVGGRTIEPAQFNEVFERDLALAEQRLPEGQNVTAALRRQVANAALQQVIAQAALSAELRRLRIAVPDAAVRQTVFAMPAFQGAGGQFDRAKLNAVLQNNGLSEARFLGMISGQIAQQQLLGALVAGIAPPALLVNKVFAFEGERRSAQMVEASFAAAAAPALPSEAALRRWYADHPWRYRSPAYRKIKLVVLTPAALAKTMTASEAELRSYYDQHKTTFVTLPRRTLQVLVVHDAAKAQALAAQWRGASGAQGADWATMQAAVKAAGGTAVTLDATTEAGIPDPALATAAFAAAIETVPPPVKTALGWDVLRVTAIQPGSARTFEQVRGELAQKVLADRAAQKIYDVVQKINDILGTGAGLGKLPGDDGLVGMSGTLDAEGITPDGGPAPIPGSPALAKAVAAAAFATPPGEPPAQLVEVPATGGGASSYYALTVEQVIPAAPKPFATVRTEVTTAWEQAALQKEAERTAAGVLARLDQGEPLAAAAGSLPVTTTPLVGRIGEQAGMPATLQRVLFGLKPHEPTMVQTASGFVVAVPDQILPPDPKKDAAAYTALRTALGRSIAGDVANAFAAALRARAHPQIDHTVFDSFVNAGQ